MALLAIVLLAAVTGWAQAATGPAFLDPADNDAASPQQLQQVEPAAALPWEGLTVTRVGFEGVDESRLKPVADRLRETVGKPLSSVMLRSGLRRLYATGLYDTIEVDGEREGDGVAVVFRGSPRTFIGMVGVWGAKGATLNTQLERASQLSPGAIFTQAKLDQAIEQMRATLASNGYREPEIKPKLTPHPAEQLIDIEFEVTSGPQSRVGKVDVTGDPGMSVDEFRHKAKLKAGSHVDRDTVNRALSGVLKHYQKQDRLAADVKLEGQQYNDSAKTVGYQFSASQGPVVQVEVEGASIDAAQVKRLVPIFEEGSVDEDLLNEGGRRLRDYFQRMGYFDVKVTHRQQQSADAGKIDILYTVDLGQRRRVERVQITGNKYFNEAVLSDYLSVQPASVLDRHGAYSQALVSADISAIESVYRNNGFADVKVTAETSLAETKAGRTAPLTVTYHVDEGAQTRVGTVELQGNRRLNTELLTPLMNTVPGQLLSPENLAGDRDALVTMYLSRGFNQASVDVAQQPGPPDSHTVNVAFRIHEGEQVFVRKVLVTGLHYTRHSTVEPAITIKPGDPLNQSALIDTQRNMYDFALFNEVNAAIQNPNGAEQYKTILLQAAEARRWVLTYGFGFEAQTGQPQNNCQGANLAGAKCNPNGKTGVSPRGIADITRNNVFGREQSASIQLTYGLLEQRINLLYQVPHFHGQRNFSFNFSGGYANSQDVTTYVASRLDGSLRWNENFSGNRWLSKANTLVYELDFRRVKVAASSLQVYPGEIDALATAVRVSGPSFTWIRDTRDSAMDTHRGTYTSFQEFLSAKPFGSQSEFNRIDATNSSYYGFDKDRIVVARSTRYGQVRTFGTGYYNGILPLPERLYAGGAASMRGFGQNAAGPRDPETGYPIGGAGALINITELRLPPPTLPWLGNTVSFVLFHDMGNVFTGAGDAWVSATRIHQPMRDLCKTPIQPSTPPPTPPGPSTSTGIQGACRFDYFSHTPGVGLRYHTPVGPIRFDFSYNLNPPIYPVTYNYSDLTEPPHVGEAPHFNFFFSLGQTF